MSHSTDGIETHPAHDSQAQGSKPPLTQKEKLHLPQPLAREGQEEEGWQRGCWVLDHSAKVILVQTPQTGRSIQKLLFGLGGCFAWAVRQTPSSGDLWVMSP